MTRRTTKTVMATLLAATIGAVAMTGPAAAGGSISFTLTPKNAEEAQVIQAGLAIYSIVNAVENGASIQQLGMNNLAGIGQNGHGNLGIVHQEGNGHAGTLQQNGNSNSYGIFQFGKGTDAHVAQNGNGQTGATFVFGW